VYAWLQLVPQAIPAGELATSPDPSPLLETESVSGTRLNVAVTDVLLFTVTRQAPVPEQPPPDQPAKLEPVA
jgi:hypothetical protein